MVDFHHFSGPGIHDRRGESALNGHRKKGRGNHLPPGKPKGYIGYSQRSMHPQFLADSTNGFQRYHRGGGIRRNRHRQRIHDNVLFRDSISGCPFHNLFGDIDPALRIHGNPLFIQRKRDQYAAVSSGQRKHLLHALLLSIYGIDQRLTIIDPNRSLQYLRRGCIDLQRKIRYRL